MISLLLHSVLKNEKSNVNNIFLFTYLQGMFIAGIADYVKKHPNASEAELAKEVQKQLELFKSRVDAL